MGSAQLVWQLSRAVLADADGLIAVIKVYMDESGTHDRSPAVTVGAYCARPKQWRDWTKDWNRQKRPIDVFHATDCQNLKGEFKDWDATQRDDFVKQLLPVIAEHAMPGVVVGIVLTDFEEAMRGNEDLRTLFGNPYSACFQWAVQHVMQMAQRHGSSERIAFFHEENDFGEEAHRSFKWLKKHTNVTGNAISLTFGSKADYVPLQAADVLAYEGNKRIRDLTRPSRRALTALDPDDSRLSIQIFNKANMQVIIDGLRAIQVRHLGPTLRDLVSEGKRSLKKAGRLA